MESKPAWQIGPVSRQRQDVGGESIDYPGRVATCPRGHMRLIPTRFSRAEFDLRCAECKRSYVFREDRS